MMRYILSFATALTLLFSLPSFAADFTTLEGHWEGKLVANLKDETGGGSPTQGKTGTKAKIRFTGTKKGGKVTGLTGSSKIGKNPSELWWIRDKGKTYTWADNTITVTSKKIPFSKIPKWVKKEAKVKKSDKVFAYKYTGCTLTKSPSKKCKIGTHLPKGIVDHGIWLFARKGDTLRHDVYYKYPSGGKRVLKQKFKKKK